MHQIVALASDGAHTSASWKHYEMLLPIKTEGLILGSTFHVNATLRIGVTYS